MFKPCLLLFFVLGVVIFITIPSLANQHHDNEPLDGKGGKPFHGEHKPFPKHPGEKPPKGKGKEPPHGGKPPHRRLLNEDIVEDTHKFPKNPGYKPPKGKGEKPPPHEHEFTDDESPKKAFPGGKPPVHKPLPEHKPPIEHHPSGDKPPKGKGKESPHEHDHKPPHRHLLGLGEVPKSGFPPKLGKGEKHSYEHKPPHKHYPGHPMEKEISEEDSLKPKVPPHKPPHKPPHGTSN